MELTVFDEIRKAIFGDKGIFGSVTDFVNKRWPPDISPEQRIQIEQTLREFEAGEKAKDQEFKLKAEALTNEAEEEFNKRVRDLEGTTADLKTIPIFGTLIIFIRGALRPTWCVATMYIDFMLLAGKWQVTKLYTDNGITPEGFMVIIINALVLGFIFGERTLRNIVPALMPIIELIWGRKAKE
jgi:hypothetical protein